MPLAPSAPLPETVELLRQILEVQREQLTYQKAAAAAHDAMARWRGFLSRWQQEFPDLADMHPMMRKPLHRSPLGRATERKQQDRPSTGHHFICHCHRKAAAAA